MKFNINNMYYLFLTIGIAPNTLSWLNPIPIQRFDNGQRLINNVRKITEVK